MLSDALKRAFVSGADYVVLDGWSPRWQWDEVQAAVDDGEMSQDGEVGSNEAQYTGLKYRLTAPGRKALEDGDG